MFRAALTVSLPLIFSSQLIFAQANPANNIIADLDAREPAISALSDQLWDLAELGYLEQKSSALLQETLRKEGFAIQAGVAEIPTAFIASYGSGEPVIAIMGEFDALPGISQAATPTQQAIEGKHSAQACGHNLFGAGSAAAAIAVKDWLARSTHQGTIRFYGTPAEEGGSGKVYLVRAGLFDDVDTVLHWHPGARNSADAETSLANKSAKFRFKGVSSHAAKSPEQGRSALDAVEAMNFMVNLMREHIPQESRIHYVITEGGIAPNVVPNFAESFYYVRHPNAEVLQTIWTRVIKAAEAAALGTGTTLEFEVIHGNHSTLPNIALGELMHKNLSIVGGVHYSPAEVVFAETLALSLPDGSYSPSTTSAIQPFKQGHTMGSTDVGDVSWNVPTAGLRTATFVPGTGLHSWQAVAAGGMSIGHKGLMVAAKTMALTAVTLIQDPAIIAQAQAEFAERRGADFEYKALLGDRMPPLDYRQ